MAVKCIERVGLSGKENSLPMTLSGGEQQRVAIARALVAEVPLILCDEPTGNLDSTNSNRVLDELLNTVSPTSSVVIATHSPKVAKLCSRIVTVADGKIIEKDKK